MTAPQPVRAGAAAAALAAIAIIATGCGAGDPDLPDPEPPAAPEAFTAANVDAWLDETLPTMLEDSGIAGAAVAVVGDGQVLTTRGFGLADTAAGTEVDPAETLFRPGSVSKVFTATAVMQLVEDGVLDLDTDVAAYLDFDIPREYEEDLTLRHLLSHTGGFEERIAGLIGVAGAEVDLREALATDPPRQVFRPGTTPSYSNYGNALAGYIVERASGLPFEAYVDREILDPLGMDSSSFAQPLPPDLADRMSNGYASAEGPAQPFEHVGTPPAGALSATADDMARFMLAQLGAGGVDLLQDATREQMFAPALDEGSLAEFAGAQRMTLGWFQEDQNGRRVVGHGGDTNWFHSHLHLYPDDGAGIFVSFNSSGTEGAETLGLRADLMAAFADRYFPGETATAAAAGEDAAAVAGTYFSSRGSQSTFLSALDAFNTTEVTALDDGRLYFASDPGTLEPGVFAPVGDGVWKEVGGDRTIAVRTEDGEVTGIVHDAAFTLLPLDAERKLGVPLLAASTAGLLLALLAWPAGAVYRKLRGRPGPGREGRRWRVLVRVGAACSVLAVAGWVAIVVMAMSLQDPSAALIRAVQALQLIGVLGLVPAAVRLVGQIRRRAGWRAVTGTVVVFLALAAVADFAFEFQLLSPDITY
ncbi:serine hydrolase domain-containing protein [Glycomyces terrestris]|uniref:Class A beta-lactamase-related serine hydrolase n=1 Tax=Glycomyces terrestris TaxID=2493553 RepID=A0A426UTK3_9ACTN|nr:serine hydrolase domain-containing protein [Glycomyces terrestris]RRR96875.1 class A beta-lactamase-related serine hydrolase [Glycomyces terrestris]